jgi:hypothetical protein
MSFLIKESTMSFFRIVGSVQYTDDKHICTCGRKHTIVESVDRIVSAETAHAARMALTVLYPADRKWDSDTTVTQVYQAEIEAQALADWNAQRPTASPNALAMARGEL